MFDENERFNRAVAAIDAAHAEDPHRSAWPGAEVPSELLYAQRMTYWLDRLNPDASDELRLAVRCQHLRRWVIPRDQFPMTRAGYHQWRTSLARLHADQAGQILRSIGYDAPTIARVQSLVRKERLKSDPQTQTLEDAACLVFLEGEYINFARAHNPDKVIDILKKTWRKMSPRGQSEAMALARSLPDAERILIEQALSG